MEFLLGDRSLQGTSVHSSEQGRASAMRFDRPKELDRALERAWGLGIRAVLTTAQPPLLDALGRCAGERPFDLWAMVPDVFKFIRDTSVHGTTGAARMRFWRLPMRQKARVSALGIANIKEVARQDFSVLSDLFNRMELGPFPGQRLRHVVLHAQMTDLAMAFGQADALRRFCSMAGEAGLEPVLMTRNLGLLKEFLESENIGARRVVAMFNPKGYAMKPDQGACERAAASGKIEIIADSFSLGGAADPRAALDYLRRNGINSLIMELDELDNPRFEEVFESIKV